MSMNIVRRVSTDSYNKFRSVTARGRFPARAAVINDKATFAGLVAKRMYVPLRERGFPLRGVARSEGRSTEMECYFTQIPLVTREP